MEGSSESGWQRSDNTSHDSGFISGRKGRETPTEWLHHRTEVGDRVVVVAKPLVPAVECSDISLREWLDNPERKVDSLECLHIFSQIVEVVNLAHSQGIVVHNVRPSCFVMSSFNHVSFIESASCLDSSSGSLQYGQMAEFKGSSSPLHLESNSQKQEACGNEQVEERKHSFPMKKILLMESNWYSSPEEAADVQPSRASDVYQLGVLLFELFCTFSSLEEKSTTMDSLRHRVLPPQLLLKWPKEASFCLWLLHPEPSGRPKIGFYRTLR
ncbi:unnamed protein product [Fraxinus pennsylvanica]|uniref:Protein kinase domain-containing protein n=1 Tax=Fraxinus pennsylvanica TaxID=56036 RepID=A0AAD2DQ73_9LAMI|nr:unnamed protein product [Fraxinus pennsylvanica]